MAFQRFGIACVCVPRSDDDSATPSSLSLSFTVGGGDPPGDFCCCEVEEDEGEEGLGIAPLRFAVVALRLNFFGSVSCSLRTEGPFRVV